MKNLLNKEPSLEFVKTPKVHTFTELQKKRVDDKCLHYRFNFDRKQNPTELWKFDSRYTELAKTLPEKKIKEIPQEPIPKTYTKQKVKDDVANKVSNTVNFPNYEDKPDFVPSGSKPNISYKWSTLEDRFRCALENRIFDEYPVAASLSTDYLPMFSSFSKDHHFNINDLPGKKMEPEAGQDDQYSTIFSRRSQMMDTLYKKKDNMFSRVSPNK